MKKMYEFILQYWPKSEDSVDVSSETPYDNSEKQKT